MAVVPVLAALFDRLLTMVERARQRRAARALSDAALHDLGLSRADVEAEAAKAPWQA